MKKNNHSADDLIKSALSGEQYIRFTLDEMVLIELCEDGSIYVRGELVEYDKQVVDAMREFLRDGGYID
jgi:hypothetical protein